MAKILIRDGYTQTGRFPGRWQLPSFTFEYRDALPAAVNDALVKMKGDGAAKTRAQVGLICSQIVSWDIDGEDGNPAPVNETNAKLLPHPLLEWLVDYVTGYKPDAAEADVKN